MNKHTPGPWHHEYGNDTGPNDGYFIEFYEVFSGDQRIGRFENEDDARLASSSPNLLAALEALLRALMSKSAMMDKNDWLAVEKANAAIAKTKGEV